MGNSLGKLHIQGSKNHVACTWLYMKKQIAQKSYWNVKKIIFLKINNIFEKLVIQHYSALESSIHSFIQLFIGCFIQNLTWYHTVKRTQLMEVIVGGKSD